LHATIHWRDPVTSGFPGT